MSPRDIRAIQFIDSFFPVTDGVVQTVHSYASLMNAGVVAPEARAPFDDSTLPYPVYRTKKLPLPFKDYTLTLPGLDPALRRFLRAQSPMLFHAHSPFAEGHFALSFARKLDIPCVSTFHSKYYDDALQITGSPLIARETVKNIVRFYDRVDSVWACSEGTAETLRGYGYRGDIFVMDNGSSMQYSAAEAEALGERARIALDLPAGKRIILFVGHMIWQKGLKVVLDAMRLLADDSDGYHLVLAGEGYRQEEIRAYARSLGVGAQFTGIIRDRELLAGLYAAADLFFFPSLYDNSPLVVREAASLGLPSLLVKGTNAAEIVQKDVSGFTAENSAAAMAAEIARVFATPGLLDSVSAAARRAIPRSWETIVGRVQEKYLSVIEEYQLKKNAWNMDPHLTTGLFHK